MTGRILWIELRRCTPAAVIALVSIVIGVGAQLAWTQVFAGRWMQLAVTNRMSLLVLLPLALAGGAWLGRREAQHRVNELFASTIRPRSQRVIPSAAAYAITIVAAYLLVFAVGTTWVFPTAGYFPGTAIVVTAVGAVSLIAAGWLGMAAGRAVPRLVTAPAVAVAGALVVLLPELMTDPIEASTTGRNPVALMLSPLIQEIQDFQTIATQVNMAQALWFGSLAGSGLLLLAAASRRAVALAMLPVMLGFAITVSLAPDRSPGNSVLVAADSAATKLVCDDHGPRVCVTQVHAGLLADIAGPVRQALATTAAKLPNAPTEAVESTEIPSWAQSGDDAAAARYPSQALVFSSPTITRSGRAELGDAFAGDLLQSVWDHGCADPASSRPAAEPSDVVIARQVAVAWLSGPAAAFEDMSAEDRQRAESSYRALISLPQEEQARRMRTAREAATECRTDGFLPILGENTP
jgi:hypothetical protein